MWLTHSTKITLGVSGDLCENRSLWFERLAGGRLAPLDARAWTGQLRKIPPPAHRHEAWRGLLLTRLPAGTAEALCGRLLDPLGLARPGRRGLAGGFALDRCSGIPYLPGRLARRAARTAAYQQLLTTKPEQLAARLYDYAMVFGTLEADWLERTQLAKTHAAHWPALRIELHQRLTRVLAEHPGLTVSAGGVKLDRFHGLVAFLPAYPWHWRQCELELSARPPSGSERARGSRETPGSDMLVVPAGTEFVFALSGPTVLRQAACGWLETGLTGGVFRPRQEAPHGRFDVSSALQAALGFERQREVATRVHQVNEAQHQARQAEEAHGQEQVEQQTALENMSALEREDFELSLLSEDQFRAKVQSFRQFNAKEQLPILRALNGPRLGFWEDLKRRAAKGGQWAQVEQAIRAAAKKAKLGRMP
jgi:hypothetical protein